MLWDLIRDFFVQHVFGGHLSDGSAVMSNFGTGNFGVNGDYIFCSMTEMYMPFPFFSGDFDGTIERVSMADWLCSTATIISITIIVVLCCLMIYKIVRLIGGLIR